MQYRPNITKDDRVGGLQRYIIFDVTHFTYTANFYSPAEAVATYFNEHVCVGFRSTAWFVYIGLVC